MPFITDMYHSHSGASNRPDTLVTGPSLAALDHSGFAAKLGQKILGQPDAVEAVTRAVSIARAGTADPRGPLSSLLLVGPTGTGKTELVRHVAAELRSSADDLCRIDMASLAQEHYAASFSGAPPGYTGSKESLSLFDRNKIEGDAYTPGIVLFDEVEKANPTVLRALLHILDCGELRLANGLERISFRNSLVFLTSNLGTRDTAGQLRARDWSRLAPLRRVLQRRVDQQSRSVEQAVKRFFDPEFFNRIDDMAVMTPFDAHTARQVTRREVDLLVGRLARESIQLDVHADVLDFLRSAGFDPVYGARGLRRTVRNHLLAPLSASVLASRPRGTAQLRFEATLCASDRQGARVVVRVPPDAVT